MLDIVSKTGSQAKITVHNPVGYPPKVTKKSPAARLDTLASIPGSLPDLRRVDLPACRYSARCERQKPHVRE